MSHIQTRVENVTQMIRHLAENKQLEKRVLAVGVEMNRRYLEYLEELETSALPITNGVDVEVEGCVIHFQNMDDFSGWLAENTHE